MVTHQFSWKRIILTLPFGDNLIFLTLLGYEIITLAFVVGYIAIIFCYHLTKKGTMYVLFSLNLRILPTWCSS